MSTADHDPTISRTNSNPKQPVAPLVPPTIPAEGPHIISEDDATHVMYLDGQLVGVAHTQHDAETTLAELIDEIERYTRVMTADMEAETAAFRLEMEAEAA